MRQPMKMAWQQQEFKSNIERFVRYIENCVWNGRIDGGIMPEGAVCRMFFFGRPCRSFSVASAPQGALLLTRSVRSNKALLLEEVTRP